jgi:putative tricarboxylic transport membrane protein
MRVNGMGLKRLKMDLRVSITLLLCLFMAIVVSSIHSAQPMWKPTKNVEIIAPAGPGGGNDLLARTILKILQEKKLVNTPIVVVNKPGGSGELAYNYMNQHAGDGHFISLAPRSVISGHIRGVSRFNYTDITPICLLFSQYSALVVKADSPIKTVKVLMDRLKKDPGSVSFGLGLGLGSGAHLTITGIAKIAGADIKKLKMVIFSSSSDAMMGVLGGHVDMTVTTAVNTLQLLEGGKLRAISSTSPNRLGGLFANVPTLKEQGLDVVEDSWRVLIGPKGMLKEQLAYWEDVVAKLVKTDEWKKDLEQDLRTYNYLNSNETIKFLREQYNAEKAKMTELGLVKN